MNSWEERWQAWSRKPAPSGSRWRGWSRSWPGSGAPWSRSWSFSAVATPPSWSRSWRNWPAARSGSPGTVMGAATSFDRTSFCWPIQYTVKKAFCFSLPSKNSITKDRKSRCWYQNIFPAAHRVFYIPLYPKNLPVPGGRLFTFPSTRKVFPLSGAKPFPTLIRWYRYGRKIRAFCFKFWWAPENSGLGKNILSEISGRFGQPRSDDAISRPTRHNFFLSPRHPVWVAEIHVTAWTVYHHASPPPPLISGTST